MTKPKKNRDQRTPTSEGESPDHKTARHDSAASDEIIDEENIAAAASSSHDCPPDHDSNMDIKEIKVVLLAIKEHIATVLSDNCKMKNDLLAFKESMNAKDRELTRTKEQLAEITSQNNSLKNELNSARLKLNQQQKDIDNMWWSQDNLEQYSRKNSLELHGIPRVAYGSTEEAVMKVTNALNVNVRSEDIEISHRIQRKHSEAIIVKFASHQTKSRVYKA